MEEGMRAVMGEIDAYGGVVKAIEDGWLQRRIAVRAKEKKDATDRGERVVVGMNRYRREGEAQSFGEVFRLDPGTAARVLAKHAEVKRTRDAARATKALDALEAAAANDKENLMPLLVECCHAYATVGEMVERLKRRWGEFQEPVQL
jgi:methylmalonyl-CoA mutase N-terminal domain/subunit